MRSRASKRYSRVGLLYKASQKAKGGDRGGRGVKKGSRSLPPPSAPKTLEELGISKPRASRWQQLAENPRRSRVRDGDDRPSRRWWSCSVVRAQRRSLTFYQDFAIDFS